MSTEASRTYANDDPVAQLVSAGERLPDRTARAILARGHELVPALVEVLEDEEAARADAPGAGYAPIHAVTLLGKLGATEAIAPMLRVLARSDPVDVIYSDLLQALPSFGPSVLEPALAAHAAADSDEGRAAILDVLSRVGVRDDRVLALLLELLDDDVELGACLVAEYGDPAALPRLGAALDRCELHPGRGFFANPAVVELEAAIEDLGGELSEDQRRKVSAVRQARAEEVAPLRSALASDPDGEDVDDDEELDDERAELIGRFTESAHATEECDPQWIEFALEYAAGYEGVTFEEFDAATLREVVFTLFPRKVSCEPSAAREIVLSLRAFWTFARDVLGHPHAVECLTVLGNEAIPRLARELANPSNFGMAKSFVMTGHAFAVDSARRTGHGEERARKKKARKAKKLAQRRNRR